MPSGIRCNLKSRVARDYSQRLQSMRKLRIPSLMVAGLLLQACAGTPLDTAGENLGAAQGSMALDNGADTQSSSKSDALVAQARALTSGERALSVRDDEMIAALQSRRAKTEAIAFASADASALASAKGLAPESGRLSHDEVLARLRALSAAARSCGPRADCAAPGPKAAQTELRDSEDARLTPEDVMRRLRSFSAPSQRAPISSVTSAFGELPATLPAAYRPDPLNAERLRAFAESQHAHFN